MLRKYAPMFLGGQYLYQENFQKQTMCGYKYRFLFIKYFSQRMGSFKNHKGNITRIFPSF